MRPLLGKSTFFLPFLLLTVSCEKEQMGDCFKGKGERVREERNISGFSAIVVHDHIRTILEPGKKDRVSIEAGENLLALIKTELKGDTLILRDRNTCNWVRSYENGIEAHIGFDELRYLEHRGTAEIRTHGTIRTSSFNYQQWNGMGDVQLKLECDSAFFTQHTGAADLTCKGSADWTTLYGGGPGFMYLEEFPSEWIYAHNDATGNMHLHVEEKLSVLIESIGSIFYRGQGELIRSERNGQGKIEKKP